MRDQVPTSLTAKKKETMDIFSQLSQRVCERKDREKKCVAWTERKTGKRRKDDRFVEDCRFVEALMPVKAYKMVQASEKTFKQIQPAA